MAEARRQTDERGLMLNTVTEKVLSGLLVLILLVGAALGVYAGFEHNAAQKAQIEQLQADNAQEKANTAAALQAEAALGAALNTKAAAQQTAVQNHTAVTTRLASAVAAAPAVASEVVPESYWQAIYGNPNAK